MEEQDEICAEVQRQQKLGSAPTVVFPDEKDGTLCMNLTRDSLAQHNQRLEGGGKDNGASMIARISKPSG
jgi:hypothetical protein